MRRIFESGSVYFPLAAAVNSRVLAQMMKETFPDLRENAALDMGKPIQPMPRKTHPTSVRPKREAA
jgi:hypothetical protein